MVKMSLLCSVVGIAILYVGALQMRPDITPIAQVDNDFVGLKAKISGQVIDMRRNQNGHVFLKVKDSSGGTISVPLFARTVAGLDENVELLDNVQVEGQVKEYRGEMEILPEKAESVKIVKSPPMEISKIDNDKVGEAIKVRGVIAKKTSVGGGSLLLKLRGKDEELKVFVFQSVVNSENFPEVREGDNVRVFGTVQVYDNELELKVESPHDFNPLGTRQ